MSLLFWRKKTPTQIQTLEEAIAEKEKQLKDLENTINSLTTTKYCLEQETLEAQEKLDGINAELDLNEGRVMLDTLGIQYTPTKHVPSGVEFQIMNAKDRMALAIKQKTYYISNKQYYVDNSASKGQKFVEAFCENNILGFNLYCEKKKKPITVDNYGATIALIEKAFNKYSKRLNIIQAKFNPEYLEYAKRLVTLELDLKVAKAKEREQIKAEKRRLREEQQLLAEAEKERKRLETERANLQKLFAKAITEQEQEEIKAKLAEVDERTKEIDWRVTHYSAGWLYIATTPSMPGIYKCGCTKQLNPLNRLAQISSASVPFPFECRGLVFSENVFDLEAKMHRRLDDKRVNKENKLKEFFYGEPKEAIKILTDEFHEEVRFIDEQWIEDRKDDNNEID